MAYIEENLKVRSKPREDSDDEDSAHVDPQEALYNIADRWKVEKQKPTTDVGSVTNSLTMLTAIPEVDLGMECGFTCNLISSPLTLHDSTRLKNIEASCCRRTSRTEKVEQRRRTSSNVSV